MTDKLVEDVKSELTEFHLTTLISVCFDVYVDRTFKLRAKTTEKMAFKVVKF